MDILHALIETEIVGNKLWRIVSLFAIVLISFAIGKIVN